MSDYPHPDSVWTHPMCYDCWREENPDGRRPTRLVEPELETCCFCGALTSSGIYVRRDPQIVHPREARR